MLSKILRWLLALLLIPIGMGYSLAFYHLLTGLRQVRTPELFILFGITAYLAVHAFVGVPKRFYVLGHEFMHAVAT